MTRTNPAPEVSGNYGAPLGRPSHVAPDAPAGPIMLQQVNIDSGGYDAGGAYWGIGAPLFHYTDGADTSEYIRAADRQAAKAAILEKLPGAVFEAFDAESYDLDSMVAAYLECALWSSTDESDESGGRPLDESYDVDDIAAETHDKAREDCAAFVTENESDLADIDATQAGHDFWLTRCRHGAGFWDRGLGNIGDRLTESAHSFGECWPYVGDDGRIHIS